MFSGLKRSINRGISQAGNIFANPAAGGMLGGQVGLINQLGRTPNMGMQEAPKMPGMTERPGGAEGTFGPMMSAIQSRRNRMGQSPFLTKNNHVGNIFGGK